MVYSRSASVRSCRSNVLNRYIAFETVVDPRMYRIVCPKLAECLHRNRRQPSYVRGLAPSVHFQRKTTESSPNQKKTRKIKEIAAPAGCVLCGDLKGPDAAQAAGALRVPVSVRGTLTTSDGRPRRRSRWDRPPRTKPPLPQSKWATRRWPICFGGGLARRHSPALVRSTGESPASPSRHCSCVSATPAQSP